VSLESELSNSTSPDWIFESGSPEATIALARRIGDAARGGEVILLNGELGAGKTCFAGGLAVGLGVVEPAVSPTYIIARSYSGSRGLILHHMDFYRLSSDADVEAAGLLDLHGPNSVALVEWPERAPAAFPQWTLQLRITVTGDESRRIEGRWGRLPHAHLHSVIS